MKVKNDPPLVFCKLTLEGFGIYQKKTEFLFSPRINTFIAKNESGKTTMLSGLTATIFGLTNRKGAASSFSLERFRNWENPTSCNGSVTFYRDSNYYMINRNFDTHEVELWLMSDSDSRKDLLVEGVHNPEGRKTLQIYEDKLIDFFGIVSIDLFTDIFFLTQPLPEKEKIGNDVQGLLSGSKGNSFNLAINTLSEALRDLTRFTGPGGRNVTAKNKSSDGIIEEMSRRIEEERLIINAKKNSADSLADFQREVQNSEKKLQKIREELVWKEKNKNSISEWRILANNYKNASSERIKLADAVKRANNLHEKLENLKEILATKYGIFQHLTDETGDKLEKLSALEREKERKREEIKKYSLQNEDKSNLLKIKREEIEKFSFFLLLGNNPVEKLKYAKRNFEICLKDWNDFIQIKNEAEELENNLSTHYLFFENAAIGELDFLKNFNLNFNELIDSLENIRREIKILEVENDNYNTRVNELGREYSDLINLPPETPANVRKKIALMHRKRELENSAFIMAEKKISKPLPKIFIATIFALIGFLLGGQEEAFIKIILTVIFAFLGFFLSSIIFKAFKNDSTDNIKKRDALKSCLTEIAALDIQLESLSGHSEAELGMLLQRLDYYRGEKERLEKSGDTLSGKIFDELKSKEKKLAMQLQEYEDSVKDSTVDLNDISAAYQRWEVLRENLINSRKRLINFCVDRFNIKTCELSNTQIANLPLNDSWRDAASLFEYFSGSDKPLNFTGLAEKIMALDNDWWNEKEAEAIRLESLLNKENLLSNEVINLESRLREETNLFDQLEIETEILKKEMYFIFNETDEEILALHELWKERKELLTEIRTLSLRLQEIIESYGLNTIEDLQERLILSEDNTGAAMVRWQNFVAENPGLPEPGNPGGIDIKYLENMDKELESTKILKEELETERNDLYRKLAILEGDNPINIAVAEIELEELRKEKESLELKADALELAHKELKAAINEYRLTYRKRLGKKASDYFKSISGNSLREIKLDEHFNIIVNDNGRNCSLDQLSKGGRDQLYCSLRFALADFLSAERICPMIFDDPFVSSDSERLENIRALISSGFKERQFFILSHNQALKSWGKEIRFNITGKPTEKH